MVGNCLATRKNQKDATSGKPYPVGYKARRCDFGIFGSTPQGGPAFLGIPREACDVEEKEAAAIVARWKGSYKLVPVAPGPETVRNSVKGESFAKYENVYISVDGMIFTGGIFNTTKKGVRKYLPYTHKLVLRRVPDGELYLDNFGSRILEESPGELRIELYQGGKIVLTKAK
jgi:hypothetical protein